MKRITEYIYFVHSHHRKKDKCVLRRVLWNKPALFGWISVWVDVQSFITQDCLRFWLGNLVEPKEMFVVCVKVIFKGKPNLDQFRRILIILGESWSF